ncbi:hypothetical protein [Ahrensia kielensis]|uniref:hypothetical protein n=1 Tax=Ahrensia kielensis TaxID=76980 RepID=UPI0003640769|nr:hypothetical protein [Ahrensia kielensis]
MSFAKFVSMISSNKLHFARCDLFEDSFEGSYPAQNIADRTRIWQEKLTEAGYDEPIEHGQFMSDSSAYMHRLARTSTYVSCWHRSNYESAAMWKLYAVEDPAIAVVTKYDLLANLLPENVYLGQVTYADYSTDNIPEGNLLAAPMYKRLSFEHEKEVRALYLAPHAKTDQELDLGYALNRPPVWECELATGSLIQRIIVSPTAPKWTVDLVTDVSRKYEIDAPVTQSDLYGDAVF